MTVNVRNNYELILYMLVVLMCSITEIDKYLVKAGYT